MDTIIHLSASTIFSRSSRYCSNLRLYPIQVIFFMDVSTTETRNFPQLNNGFGSFPEAGSEDEKNHVQEIAGKASAAV